jgi:hypothetical protein
MSLIRKTDFNPANQSAFGTLETAELTPVIQGDWVYGINTQIWSTPVTSGTGATVDTSSSRLRIQSGTASNGYAYITSRRPVRYRAGEGTMFRLTPIFTAGVADNIQLWGMGTIESNTPYDGYFFGYNGTSFGICHYIRGTAAWTAQGSWNGDSLPFTWDPTKGTPVMIKFPYLGYGNIFFYVQNPSNGAWVLVHTIRYANTVATTQLSNPTLSVLGFTLNSGNTTNMIMYSGSVGAFISGVRSTISNPKWSTATTLATVTTENCLINLRNCTTSFSSSAASGVAILRLKIGATIGGSPSYTTVNGTTANDGITITSGNSISSFDIAGTTVSGGSLTYSVVVDNPNSGYFDFTDSELFVSPGETLTISGFSTVSSTLGASINWSEDI